MAQNPAAPQLPTLTFESIGVEVEEATTIDELNMEVKPVVIPAGAIPTDLPPGTNLINKSVGTKLKSLNVTTMNMSVGGGGFTVPSRPRQQTPRNQSANVSGGAQKRPRNMVEDHDPSQVVPFEADQGDQIN